jgi:flavorubredoxin
MKARKIKEGIYWMGAVDWDRRLFDSLIPLPDGTSYNAYLIQGSEKTALVDTVDPSMVDVLPYISMHGSTEKMVEYLVSALAEKGVTVHQFNLAVTDIGKLAITLVDAATIVIGTPTVHVGPHPNVFYAAYLANALRPKLRFASIIGSYGWSSKAIEQIAGLIPNLQVEILDPVLCKGFPREADFRALDNLAAAIAEKHKEHNFT